jgi:hypothetical protein
MNPTQLKDNELNSKIKNLVNDERKLTQMILEHIAEIDRRKMYLKMAHPSLFDYLTKELNYSAGAAQRRIDAARMFQKVPEVAQKIENGRLNLAQISKVQQMCRQIKKESGKAVPTHIQKNVLSKIENLNSAQTDLLLAQEFQLEIKAQAKTHIQRDESTRIEVTFSKEEMAIITSVQALLSHKTGGGLRETFVQLAKDILKKNSSSNIPNQIKSQSNLEIENNVIGKHKAKTQESTATVALTVIEESQPALTVENSLKPSYPIKTIQKSVTPRLRKEILNRDQFCQFTNPNTGKVCGARHYLEVDHIVPQFVGGDNTPENLRALCKNHNIYRFEQNL